MASIKIKSDVTGSVWKILKKAGEAVEAGEEIMLIESMKMEIPVMVEDAGQLGELSVAEGDPVQEGQLLAVVHSS